MKEQTRQHLPKRQLSATNEICCGNDDCQQQEVRHQIKTMLSLRTLSIRNIFFRSCTITASRFRIVRSARLGKHMSEDCVVLFSQPPSLGKQHIVTRAQTYVTRSGTFLIILSGCSRKLAREKRRGFIE